MLIISAAYTIAMVLSCPNLGSPVNSWVMSPLNPAIALAEITFATFSGSIDAMSWAWIYLVFSWGGSLVAVVVFEFVFKKAQNAVVRHDDEEELANEEESLITQPMVE